MLVETKKDRKRHVSNVERFRAIVCCGRREKRCSSRDGIGRSQKLVTLNRDMDFFFSSELRAVNSLFCTIVTDFDEFVGRALLGFYFNAQCLRFADIFLLRFTLSTYNY